MHSFVLQPKQDMAFLGHIRTKYLQLLKYHDDTHAQKLKKAFQVLVLNNNRQVSRVIQNDTIASALCVAEESNQFVKKVQSVILMHLYEMLFTKYIKTAEKCLHKMICSKMFWSKEKFYLTHKRFWNHPLYAMYSVSYRRKVFEHIAVLDDLEEQVAQMLGIALYGLNKLKTIEDENSMEQTFFQAIQPLYDAYGMVLPTSPETANIELMYKDMTVLYETMVCHIHDVDQMMQYNQKPSFVVQHWAATGVSAVSSVALLYLYYKNLDQMPMIQDKTYKAATNFVQEYVVDPIKGLKKVLWDGQAAQLAELKEFEKIPRCELFATLLLNGYINAVGKTVESWLEALRKTFNKDMRMVNNTILKNQQINFYISAVGPVVWFTYLTCKGSKSMYNTFIKHEGWYVPMKYALRVIERILNKDFNLKQRSFVDDGKIYMQAMYIRQHISCLDGEELILMEQDLHDLTSFDLSYQQKKLVVDRMYRTYQFLK